jgi:Hg(II)-responsive transcriptional regulator
MGLRTGQVAKAAGVNVETLRYYERRGILAEPKRRSSGYREYPPETVDLIRFVKRAQELGFGLEQIQELLKLRRSPGRSCARVQSAAQEKIAEVDEKMKALKAMKKALAGLVRSCEQRESTLVCPLLESLNDGVKL